MKVVALKWWLIYQHTPEADIAVAVSSDNVAHISCVKGGVPTCSDADAPQPFDGLSIWVTSPRRAGGLFRGEIDRTSISGRPGQDAL